MAEKSGPVLGIDLGTTNSVVAVADGSEVRVLTDSSGNHLVPSVVSFHPDGRILVGREARERRLTDAANTIYSTKRLIGRPFLSPEVQRARHRLAFTLQNGKNNAVEVQTRSGTYALPEISAMVLRHLRAVAEEALGETCERAVVTVPANFNELQRSATAAAGKVAGLEILRVLNEPTAATLAYGYGREEHGSVLVYDLGGGTFDVTILDIDKDALEVISTAGDTFLGGDDVDVALAERFSEVCIRDHRFDPRSDPQAFERVRAAAEWAKCRLSSDPKCSLTLEELFFVQGQARDVTFQLTREELAALAKPLVAGSFEVVNEALRACGRRPKEIGHVVLVGGSTRMPLVVEMVSEFFGRTPRFERDPDLVVAQGAAIQGWMLGGRAGAAPRTALARVPLRRQTIVGGQNKPEPRPKQPAFAPSARVARVADDRPARFIEEHVIRDDVPVRGTPARRSVPPPPVIAPPPGAAVRPQRAIPVGAASESVLQQLDAVETPPDSPDASAAPRPLRKQTLGSGAPLIATPSSLAGDAPFASVAGYPVPAELRALAQPESGAGASDVFFVEGSVAQPLPRELASDPDDDAPQGLPAPREVHGRAPPAMPPPPPPGRALVPGRPIPPPAPAPDSAFSLSSGDFPRPSRASIPGVPLSFDAGGGLSASPMGPGAAAAPAAPSPASQSVIPMAMTRGPILMDVTPLALGIETVSGYCQHLIPRNAPVPTEKTRVFVTGRDDQTAVEIRICQGDSKTFGENEALGSVVLDALAQKRRGEVRIEVTFLIDSSGILDIRAVDVDTKREQRTRITLRGGLDQGEIAAMRLRQEAEMALAGQR